ncbi:MAG TPA: tetratricopeptide repeat protein [Candidatus Obscuribacterales bacterium]
MSAPDAFARGRGLHLAGALDQAWAHYQQAAARCHGQGAYWLWLALLAWQIEQAQTARDCLAQALQRQAELAAVWPELDEALRRTAIDLLLAQPGHGSGFAPWLNWLAWQPLDAISLTRVWEALLAQGLDPKDLARRLEQSAWPQGWHLLARARMRQGRPQAAERCWQRLLTQSPDYAPAHLYLGHLALQAGQIESALSHYRQALALQPIQPDLHYHLGRVSLTLLEPEQAEYHFAQALKQAEELGVRHPLWHVQQAMAYLPLATEDESALAARLLAQATALRQQIPLLDCLPDVLRGGIDPCFDLNYLSQDDGPVRAAFADIFILPPRPRLRPRSGPLRLGVVVTPGHEGMFLFGSRVLLTQLAAAGIEILVLALPPSLPLLQPLASFARLLPLPEDLAATEAAVRPLELDLVYFWEVGTDPLNYFLPMLQLGRAQFTSWGSVSTTGQASMLYFLSAQDLETPESRAHYRESLQLLPVLPMLYEPGMLPRTGKDRRALGLPEAAQHSLLLGIPHNPQKLSADFLQALRAILEAAPSTRALLVESRHPAWQRSFVSRVLQQLGPAATRVHWLPRLPGAEFCDLLAACDLLLDPFAFGSGKLAFEALGLGVPLLTLPGRRLRGRIVTACYRQIGYEPLIAADPADYVAKAVSMLTDPGQLAQHAAEITHRRPLLMQHPDVLPAVLEAMGRMSEQLTVNS